jgi:DNA-binding LacI/PurR family transcriptional regulator
MPDRRSEPKPAGPRPRLIDVAEAAGVTVSTASRVLNGDPTVSARPETRARISEAARQLSYIPNALARGLRRARTMTIGLVLPDVAYAVNAEIIRGAERSAAAEGYVLLIADAAEFGPTGIAYERLVMQGRVDGLLVASGIVGESGLDALRELPLPVVHVNRRGGESGVSVSLDDERGVALAVDHLVELGHARFGHIAGPPEIDTARRRHAGFVERTRAHGLATPPRYIRRTELNEAGGYDAMRALLAISPRPTAVVASSFASAVGAMSAIVSAGLRVPDDVSVIAFHDAPIGAYLNPGLTTVRMPLAEMAEAAVRTLRRLMDGSDAHDIVVESPSPELVVRDSTGPPAG